MEQDILALLATIVAGAGAVVATVQKKVATALASGGVALIALAEAVKAFD